MSLHPKIPDKNIPAALKRPLVFGDREQIDALRQVEEMVEEIESEKKKLNSGEYKKYRVAFEVTGDTKFVVVARNKDDALRRAEKLFDPYDLELDYWSYTEELKPKKTKGGGKYAGMEHHIQGKIKG